MGTRTYEADAYGGNEDGGIDRNNLPDADRHVSRP